MTEQGNGTRLKKQKSFKEYGSIKEWVNHEWLLPYLIIGGCRSDFWKLTPKTIQIDFEAYQRRQKRETQDRWELGAYFKLALKSSILAATLADNNTASKLPSYPEKPFEAEIEAQNNDMSEEQIKAERLRAYCFFKTLGRKNK